MFLSDNTGQCTDCWLLLTFNCVLFTVLTTETRCANNLYTERYYKEHVIVRGGGVRTGTGEYA